VGERRLRERPEDIPLLVRHLVQQFSRRMNKGIDTIPSETMTALVRYPWPANERELQNVIERAVIVSTGLILELSTEELHPRADVPPVSNHRNGNLRATLENASGRKSSLFSRTPTGGFPAPTEPRPSSA
jgi:DNA-binding NtrC family response regulator